MPKFTIPIQSLTAEDAEEVGQEFARSSLLRETSAKLPNGLILKNGTLGLLLEKLIPSIVSASSGQKQITDKNSFFSDLRKLVSKEFVFPKDLQDEVLGQVKKLSYPLVIATSAKVDNKTDLLSFEMVIFEKEELLPTLKTAFFSPLNPLLIPEISYESLKRLSLAIKITEKPQAEVSGKVLANKQSVKIFSQWGEFDPNSSSDQTIFSQNRVKEENYQPVLQANQIVLKNKKYVLINVAKQFQFATKLDSTNTEKLAKVAESISRKIVSPIELRFSVCDDEVFVTDLLINEIPEQIETVPLIDFLTLYKKLSPVVMGVRSGPLRKIVSQKDLKNLRRGEIAVVRHLDKRVFPALKKASAVVIENSKDVTSDKLAKLKDLGKAAIAGNIGELPNKVVTVDGKTGKIYLGAFPPPYTKTLVPLAPSINPVETKHATQVFLEFHSQENLAGLDETSISGYVLPNLSERVVQAIGHQHKPMIVATTAENFEKNLETTKHLRNKEGFTNLHLCLPEITTSTEFVELKKKVSVEGLHRGGSFKLFCTIANPASALNFGEIVESGLDGVVIDFLSLINKTYGKKFTLEELKKVNDKSVLILINQLLNLCQQFKVFSLLDNILIGEDNSLASYLGKGLKGVVSSASDFEDTKKSLSRAEKQLLTR